MRLALLFAVISVFIPDFTFAALKFQKQKNSFSLLTIKNFVVYLCQFMKVIFEERSLSKMKNRVFAMNNMMMEMCMWNFDMCMPFRALISDTISIPQVKYSAA